VADFVLGVDGGGTKTHCALFDLEGNKIDQVSWGATNHECLAGAFEELRVELGRMMAHILTKNGIAYGDLAQCVFGLAGVDTRKQHTRISDMFRELGVVHFLLCNDSFLGVKAGATSGSGICAINGTGFSVGGIDPSGRMLQIGGQGDLTGDFGGGSRVAQMAVSTVYNALFAEKSETLMTDLFFKALCIGSRSEFLETLLDVIDSGQRRLSDFNRIVFKAAQIGDPQAIGILQKMGTRYAQCINAVVGELAFDEDAPLEIVLAGSLFVRGESPAAIETLQKMVRETHPGREVAFSILTHPPVAGAVLWALEGFHVEDAFPKVVRQF